MADNRLANDCLPTKRKRGGSKKGKHESYSKAYWHEICGEFKSGKWESQLAFLRTKCGDEPTAIKKQSAFSRWLVKFDNGELDNLLQTQGKRQRETKYPGVEKKLNDYIELRSRLFRFSKHKEQKVGNS